MHLVERFWMMVTSVTSIFTMSGIEGPPSKPQALLLPSQIPQYTPAERPYRPKQTASCDTNNPLCFKPPGAIPGSDFRCDYTKMVGWSPCFDSVNRKNLTCWLSHDSTSEEWNIYSDYEATEGNSTANMQPVTPMGIDRYYELVVVDNQTLNADGLNFTEGKFFVDGETGQPIFPGPLIEGCWGDTLHINLTNKMKHNGTTLHWHGLRQYFGAQNDGVNGVTQCPVAPEDDYIYNLTLSQYGTAWYHSHFSVQYADGVQAPLTIHGPFSNDFDETIYPLMMTDWGHNSAFEAVWTSLSNPSILLDGRGDITRYNTSIKLCNETSDVPCAKDVPGTYTIGFNTTRAKRYLLRLINTSFESHFVFSIDNHWLEVISTDFVAIHPYRNVSVMVGIGQRYNVIVEAQPTTVTTAGSNGQPDPDGIVINPVPTDGNFWIRTWQADCFFHGNSGNGIPCTGSVCGSPGYERTGILRYDNTSTTDPTSISWPLQKYGDVTKHLGCDSSHLDMTCISLDCSDETYSSIKPIVPWTVGMPSNSPDGAIGEQMMVKFQKANQYFPLALAQLTGTRFNPLQINWGDPAFLHFNYTGAWDPRWVVYPEGKYQSTDWVYLVIEGFQGNSFGAHPIHLHGHDYAILQQIENAVFPDGLNLNGKNPPRRDVVLLPTSGYVVIAFKTDNPGPWLMHCHIANHAAFGLAAQIMERRQDSADRWPRVDPIVKDGIHFGGSNALAEVTKGCNNWLMWSRDCNNWWPGDGAGCNYTEEIFAPDSGI